MSTTTIKLNGLTCEACTKMSLKRLSKIADVTNVEALAEQGNFTVTANRSITKEEVAAALEGTAYSVVSVS